MSLEWLFGDPRTNLPYSYLLYRKGKYKPSEWRPQIIVPGERKWYAPWKRTRDVVHEGMSEAMAFRIQDAMLARSPKI